MTSDRDELADTIVTAVDSATRDIFGPYLGGVEDDGTRLVDGWLDFPAIADAILSSDWFARVKRESGAASLEHAAELATVGRDGDTAAVWLLARAAELREGK